MSWQDELLSAAKDLCASFAATPFDPLWERCSQCGLSFEARRGHECPLEQPA